MSLNNIFMFCIFLSILNIQANAMEKPQRPQQIFTGFTLNENKTKKDIVRHGKDLLEMHYLNAFLAHVEQFSINPNYFMTANGETALGLACRMDFKGALIQRLLDWGGIYMHRNTCGVLVFLQIAIEANNYEAVYNLCTSENIRLSQEDILIASEFRSRYRKTKVRRRVGSF